MKAVVLLSGCGVYDGAEIHESVLLLLALDQRGIAWQCTAPDAPQHHVINHRDGSEQAESRNMLTEAARIARGHIVSLAGVSADAYDTLVIPGGFGAAKNLCQWAFSGPEGSIREDVKALILGFHEARKPILATCISPVLLAQAFAGSGHKAKITVGTTDAPSDNDPGAVSQGMESLGADPQMCPVQDYVYDSDLQLITTPCYMMDAPIHKVHQGIDRAVDKLVQILQA